MTETIDAQELKALVQSVFSPTSEDRHLLLMVDVPDDALPDTDMWRIRRGLAQDWCGKLDAVKEELGLDSVRMLAYPNVHSNNADLPAWGVFVASGVDNLSTDKLAVMENRVDIEDILDEKLGLHIAFGRSDHFGGAVGVKDFSSPEAVIHIDRIYIPETAPRIHVERVRLTFPDGGTLDLMRDGRYTIF